MHWFTKFFLILLVGLELIAETTGRHVELGRESYTIMWGYPRRVKVDCGRHRKFIRGCCRKTFPFKTSGFFYQNEPDS